jgi:hypothetical protein
MKIAFYSGADTLDRLIEGRTNGNVAHCELLFGDGSSFSASQWDGGTRFVPQLKITDAWTVVDIGPVDEAALKVWCTGELHKKYNWIALVKYFTGIHAQAEPDPETWFCSEICVAALQYTAKLFLFLEPIETSPEALEIAALARAEALLPKVSPS